MVLLLFFALWAYCLFHSSLAFWSFSSAKSCLSRSSSPWSVRLLKTKLLPIKVNKKISSTFMFIWYPRPGEVKMCPRAVIFVSDNLPPRIFPFPSLFFHLLTYTNPSHDRDAKWWVRGLLLFFVSGPSVFDNHHTTLQDYYRYNNNRHRAMFSFVFVLQTNQESIAIKTVIPHCFITHLLGLILIRDIFQLPWIYLSALIHIYCVLKQQRYAQMHLQWYALSRWTFRAS